jgi:hypothetical protein
MTLGTYRRDYSEEALEAMWRVWPDPAPDWVVPWWRCGYALALWGPPRPGMVPPDSADDALPAAYPHSIPGRLDVSEVPDRSER